MKRLTITVSFKHTVKDIELYAWIDSFEDKSYSIKNILRDYNDKTKEDKKIKE